MLQFDSDGFGRIVKLNRKWRKLSLRAASKQLGISASTLSRIERGGKPDIDDFIRLIAWVNLSAERFAIEVQETTPDS